MATVKGGLVDVNVWGGKVRYITLSGTVMVGVDAVVRDIKAYRKDDPERCFETVSDAAGDWSLDVPGNANDFFRIIAIGIDGENSEIFEHVVGI